MRPGEMLGPYRVEEKLGEGGMGVVYKARDTRLDRTVAIKVLPPDVDVGGGLDLGAGPGPADPAASRAERRARFEREAKTIAALNHTHICALYDVGTHDPSTGSGPAALYLVMEYLSGFTLAERLARGPLPLEQALTVATEVADALAAAHRQGVVHRDLKPGNVMLTKAGGGRQSVLQAKLLDFGLAKLTGRGDGPAALQTVTMAPTQAPVTGQGRIVGTLQYMAPEQLEGKPVDGRTDLWALGAILYEMVTGRRAFDGASAVSVMSAIMEHEPPPIASLQPVAPPALDRLVRRCLAKSPDDRPDTAHDVASELRGLSESIGSSASAAPAAGAGRWRRWAPFAAVGLAAAAFGASLLWLAQPARQPAAPAVVRAWLDLGPAAQVTSGKVAGVWSPTPGGSATAFAWTPDGRALVFVGRRETDSRAVDLSKGQLWVRPLDGTQAVPLAGTDGARSPVVSPDGLSVGFWATSAIRRVPLAGGPVTPIVENVVTPPAGIAWARSGEIIYPDEHGVLVRARAGGRPTPVTTLQGSDVGHSFPVLVDEDRAVLFTARSTSLVWGTETLVAQDLATGERTTVLEQATDARDLASGHLLFMRLGVLWAVRFDARTRRATGEPVPLTAGIAQAVAADHPFNSSGAGQFAVSPAGALAFIPGTVPSYPEQEFVRVDWDGQVTPLAVPPGPYLANTRRCGAGSLMVDHITPTEVSLWRHELARPGSVEKVLSGPETQIWACVPRDGTIAFLRQVPTPAVVLHRPSEGADEVLLPRNLWPIAWTPSGSHLILLTPDRRQLWAQALSGPEPRLRLLVETGGSDWLRSLEVSPDGRWLVYGSSASGQRQLYLRAFQGPGRPRQITIDGGSNAAWHPSSPQLFFTTHASWGKSCRADKGRAPACMNVVDIDAAGNPGTPRQLFTFDGAELAFVGLESRCYDVSEDGRFFYALRGRPPDPVPPVTHVNLVLNWFEELKAKLPPGR